MTGPSMTPLPMPETAEFVWSDAFALGHPEIDDTHREFVACVQALLSAPEAQVPDALQAFAEHARRHFAQEDEWMARTSFPAADCHLKEHAAVLGSVREVQAALGEGRAETCLARSLARELVRWFPGHADYMDAALAQWLTERRHGGVPVVLRHATPSVCLASCPRTQKLASAGCTNRLNGLCEAASASRTIHSRVAYGATSCHRSR